MCKSIRYITCVTPNAAASLRRIPFPLSFLCRRGSMLHFESGGVAPCFSPEAGSVQAHLPLFSGALLHGSLGGALNHYILNQNISK